MSLLEDFNACAICEAPVNFRTGPIPPYFCRECFAEHKEDIFSKAPWAKFLANAEKQRRKRRNRLIAAGHSLEPAYILKFV